MKKLSIILSLFIFACDDDESDCFIGDWKFEMSNPEISAVFAIKRSGHTYVLENPIFNGSPCDQALVHNAHPGKFIDVLAVGTYNPFEGVSFKNCRLSSDGKQILVDTVGHTTAPMEVTLYFNQVITKQ
jgi:hypothetical protein